MSRPAPIPVLGLSVGPRTPAGRDAHTVLPAGVPAALYLMGSLFLFTPLADGIANSLPLQLSLVSWRYGAIGSFANYLISMVFGALLLTLTAAVAGHRRTLRLLGWLWLLALLGLLGLSADFLLGVLELRNMVPPEQHFAYDVGAAKALAKYGTNALAFALIATISFRRRSA